ncbi:efflux RND transporter periplasmic adaptor subunit [Thiocapsa bogorovii]|uniref:efflux RND transporter periplasmic adaptor subunit n=1 Tax=Thiocapsa bogorovii TaxID=521689 RepID=UPI001E592E58|nr:HlyD family efflux transporter periplasmic adaptor subunit [Thiocapsa bogorovii]UHD17646.1 HlyD family efflux transporter periplasmic adaptor subunit [Thiocapsa bogorovii]
MSLSKRLITGFIALTILGLLALALMPSPVPVSATLVRQDVFVESVEDEGRTRLRDVYTVSAPISGYLRRVELEPGDQVAADQVLFELEPLPAPALDPRSRGQAREALAAAQAHLEEAEANLAARRTESELARTEYDRSETLHRRQLISSEERGRRLAQRDAAAAAEQAARHAVEVAQFELESARALVEIADGKRSPGDYPVLGVRSPIDGVVTRRHRCCEGPIESGEAVLELGDLDALEVQVDLLSVDAVRVRPGMRVILERWGGEDALEGRVRLVEPAGFEKISALGVEEQRVPVWVEIVTPRDRWRHLGDGYRVEARFILWEGDDVVQIPTSALFRYRDRWAVFVADQGRARLRLVEVGRRSGLWTQITMGLEPDDIVVTHPGDRVHDGAHIAAEIRPYA